MGSSKKSKDKDRDKEHKRKRRHRSRSRSRSRERRHGKKSRDEYDYDRDHGVTRDDERQTGREEGGSQYSYPSTQSHSIPGIKDEQADEFVNKSSGGGGGGEISLSIEETNRLRAKLGLKPLEDTSVKKEGDEDGPEKPGAQQGVHAPAANLTQLKQTENMKRKLLEIKEKRLINQKLGKVKKLADSDSDEEGALSWIKKSRKLEKEKELAAKRAKMLEDMDQEFGISGLIDQEFKPEQAKTYDSKDLRGLRVLHDQDRFKEGVTTILTLKDKGILDDDGEEDVLVNYNIIDDEKAELNVTNKKKKPTYNPYDEPTIDEYGMLKSQNILSKYDEEIDGKKLDSFELGSGGKYSAHHERVMRQYQSQLKQQAQSLELPAPEIAKEFYTQPEMESFKKVKKRVRKIRKKPKMLKADDLIPLDAGNGESKDMGRRAGAESMDTSEPAAPETTIPGLDLVEPNPMDEVEVIGPAEDLTGVPVEDESGMEQTRVLNKAKRLRERKEIRGPEEAILSRIPENEMEEDTPTNTGWASSVVLNSTSEFCRALGDIPTYGQAGNRPEEEEDELNEFERELAEQRRRQEEEDEMMGTGWQSVEIDEQSVDIKEEERIPLDEEPIVDSGLATALKLANQKGYLELEVKKKGASAPRTELEAQSYSIEDKRYEDLDDKYRKRDRYAGGITQDFKELNYKPDVKLEYVDETGRSLNAKEAFRQLSHRFHGKGSGKKKTEKRTKKLEQDQLLKGASSTDTPLGTVELLREKQKSERSAYLILSGANKATLTGGSISKPT